MRINERVSVPLTKEQEADVERWMEYYSRIYRRERNAT